MTNVTANNLINSDWCLDINLTDEVRLDSESLDADVVIESIIVPIVGSFGITGALNVWADLIYVINYKETSSAFWY